MKISKVTLGGKEYTRAELEHGDRRQKELHVYLRQETGR